MFIFLGALILAGIIMAYGESASRAMQRIISRLTGPTKGQQLHRLSTATVRSVAVGVIGLFLGAVLLAVAYQMFMDWVDEAEEGTGAEPGPAEAGAQVSSAGE